MKKSTVCLAMIVRDESAIIERCLESVCKFVDTYCIVDTGSKDDTPSKIVRFFSDKGLNGKLFHVPFIDFATNRTDCLERAKVMADYVLVMDADEEFVDDGLGFDYAKHNLTADWYSVKYSGDFLYTYPVLFNSKAEVVYHGMTHEYPVLKKKYVGVTEVADFFTIVHHADGGTRAEKYKRDIKLLKASIERDPYDTRSMFYLANSYYDINEELLAIETYIKRIEMPGGYMSEKYFCIIRLVQLYLKRGKVSEALYHVFESMGDVPDRLDILYYMGVYYYDHNNYEAAFFFLYKIANAPLPSDLFFIDKPIYEYLASFYCGLAAYYTGRVGIFAVMNERVATSEYKPGDRAEAYVKTAIENRKFYTS